MTKNQMINGGIGIGIGLVSLVFIAFYLKRKPPRPHDYDVSTKRYIETPSLKKFNINSNEVFEKSKAARIKELTDADSRLAASLKYRTTARGKKHTEKRKHNKVKK
jgi:hypothetical protein